MLNSFKNKYNIVVLQFPKAGDPNREISGTNSGPEWNFISAKSTCTLQRQFLTQSHVTISRAKFSLVQDFVDRPRRLKY